MKIFSFCGFLREIHHKKSIRGRNVLATVIFLAFDPSVTSGKLDAQSRRNIFNLHSADGRNEALRVIFIGCINCVFQEHETVTSFLVETVYRDRAEGILIGTGCSDRCVEDLQNILSGEVGFQIPKEHWPHCSATNDTVGCLLSSFLPNE